MTVYPYAIDSDEELSRVDDNITELGGQAIDEIRSAVFAMQEELGVKPSGSAGTVVARLDKSLLADGSINPTALSGFVASPVINSNVDPAAAIAESKLDLDHSTNSLKLLIDGNTTNITSLNSAVSATQTNLVKHYSGTDFKHLASHINLNNPLTDRTSTNVQSSLEEINNELIDHETNTNAHDASNIDVDTSSFVELPSSANTVQKALEAIDSIEISNIGQHRAVQHAEGIPRVARANAFGSATGRNVVPSMTAETYLLNGGISPSTSASNGDNLVKLLVNSNYVIDSKFAQVRSGDVITISYTSGIEASFLIDSVAYNPGTDLVVRINGFNFEASATVTARIDKPLYNRDTMGILATAACNSDLGNVCSLVVGSPKGAVTLGLGFNAGQLDSTHYMLYLALYPSGNPLDHANILPGIDVTGNAGATPGTYTLSGVIQSTNDQFRKLGYNYRFIAFEHDGEFGIMLADSIGGASFSIINGILGTGGIVVGTYTNNVINATGSDDFDALGFGVLGSNIASPEYLGAPTDSTSSQFYTKVVLPFQNRNYVVNGKRLDRFAESYLAEDDGHWDGYISNRSIESGSVVTTYTIDKDLSPAGLMPGKSIVIQSTLPYTSPLYLDLDYGRFIIKDVTFTQACGTTSACTNIKVVNALHGTGIGNGYSSEPNLDVKLYFSADSIGFNDKNVIDSADVSSYKSSYEVFVNDQGNTFSHERARMIAGAGTSTLLDSTKWNIKNVSAKLRGYSSTSNYRKFIRLLVTSYDSATGEIVATLSDPSNSATKGLPVTGRNHCIKLYDETNVDYMEFSCADTISVTNKYIDIELFSSLQLQDELMLLATCQVYGNRVTELVDRRSFGSIHADDLSTSAKEFISAGDRLLHENGIIKGFGFVKFNPTNSSELYFTGGTALVNGRVLSVNNSEYNMPKIILSDITGVSTSEIKYCICVNDDGALEGVFVTDNKANVKLFGNPVDSYTFSELVNRVKRLTPLYLVALPSSTSVSDVRRFVTDMGRSIPLTLSSDGFVGNFKTFDSVVNWINNYGLDNSTVKLKGKFVIDTAVDLRGLKRFVIFEGDGCEVTVNSEVGFYVGSNTHFKNVKFIYTKTSSVTSYIDPFGCLSVYSPTNIENVTIDSCSFEYKISNANRKSFITFALSGSAELIENVNVVNCKFTDGSLSKLKSVVAFYNDGSTKLLRNINVESNICNSLQGIYLTQDFVMVNCNVKNNKCGYIGFLTSSGESLVADGEFTGLNIAGNTCLYIGVSLNNGNSYTLGIGTPINPTRSIGGNISIVSNYCCSINLSGVGLDVVDANIQGNYLTSVGDRNILGVSLREVGSKAINVAIYSDSRCRIVNNTISGKLTYKYDQGIFVRCSSVVSENVIGGISKNIIPTGREGHIWIYFASSSFSREINVSNNRLVRGSSEEVFAFVFVDSTISNSGVIVDNILNTPYISGTDSQCFKTTDGSAISSTFTIERNKNQTTTQLITAGMGSFGMGHNVNSARLAGMGDSSSLITTTMKTLSSDNESVSIYFTDTDGTTKIYFYWIIDLNTVLPNNVSILKASMTWEIVANNVGFYDTCKVLTLQLVKSPGVVDSWSYTPTSNNVTNVSIGTSEFTTDFTLVNKYYTSKTDQRPILRMSGELLGNITTPNSTNIKNVTVTYRY